MKRNIGIGFWALFTSALALHFYIGGVVVDTKIEGSEHLIMMRENRGVWRTVSMATYWAHFITKYAMFAICISAAAWMAWRWLWRGKFKN